MEIERAEETSGGQSARRRGGGGRDGCGEVESRPKPRAIPRVLSPRTKRRCRARTFDSEPTHVTMHPASSLAPLAYANSDFLRSCPGVSRNAWISMLARPRLPRGPRQTAGEGRGRDSNPAIFLVLSPGRLLSSRFCAASGSPKLRSKLRSPRPRLRLPPRTPRLLARHVEPRGTLGRGDNRATGTWRPLIGPWRSFVGRL